uniref:Uncharacterized protein n=1 Tax=Musa acuminata subsp. malaccensis TaxID=214687 RepID=A0A804KA09_MUSAM
MVDASDLVPNLPYAFASNPQLCSLRRFNSAVVFLEQGAYHAAIHISRGEAKKLSLMNTQSSRFQPISAIDAFEANQIEMLWF